MKGKGCNYSRIVKYYSVFQTSAKENNSIKCVHDILSVFMWKNEEMFFRVFWGFFCNNFLSQLDMIDEGEKTVLKKDSTLIT